MVGSNKRVLEVGCAGGHMTEALQHQGCRVVGIDVDPEAATASRFAEDVIMVDLDRDDLVEKLGDRRFDVALFGDVLEHLRDPLELVRRVRELLVPGGYVVVSVPNVTHVDVRLALLEGRFEYRDLGLLDRTHLRFFTADSIEDLLRDAGLIPIEHQRIVVQPFCTEVGANAQLPPEVLDIALRDPEALTYQFVIKAVLDDGNHATQQLADRCRKLEEELYRQTQVESALREQLTVVHRDASFREQQVAALQLELSEVRTRLERELGTAQGELDALRATKLFRYAAPWRRAYGRLIRHR
jgi:2-polyprenyl-3-methyl-5-hydroxy-6-metoxy-1,4-benzoquinol methylase